MTSLEDYREAEFDQQLLLQQADTKESAQQFFAGYALTLCAAELYNDAVAIAKAAELHNNPRLHIVEKLVTSMANHQSFSVSDVEKAPSHLQGPANYAVHAYLQRLAQDLHRKYSRISKSHALELVNLPDVEFLSELFEEDGDYLVAKQEPKQTQPTRDQDDKEISLLMAAVAELDKELPLLNALPLPRTIPPEMDDRAPRNRRKIRKGAHS